ncbi:MAG: methyltransferase domain-containing protein [Planctomycetales bacterium]|nr:methyltransferase domain-containing protein [Planctomycetales bacterium]
MGRMELPLTVENAVRDHYSAASKAVEPALCCPVNYDRTFLAVLPAELIERDYGCGDPSRFVREGETGLDLGSGGGKICYIASQIVGPRGRVIGIDVNEDMLALARKYQAEIAGRIGWDNVKFHWGRIQDLSHSLDEPDRSEPFISSGSIDVVLSNCVLNLVHEADREQLFREVFRVLRPGGRAAISDIVSNRPVPAALRADPTLWSGCISGAFEEQAFLQAFSAAGFERVELVARQEEPWTVVEGIEFRSVTVQAVKGDPGLLNNRTEIAPSPCCSQPECC